MEQQKTDRRRFLEKTLVASAAAALAGCAKSASIADAGVGLVPATSGASAKNVIFASAYSSLDEALSAILSGSKLPCTLIVDTLLPCNSSLTLPSNLSLSVFNGGRILQGAHDLVIKGSFEAGLYQAFDAASGPTDDTSYGQVSFESALAIVPQWWGALADGATDCTAAIQAAYDSAQASGRSVYFPDGKYACASLKLHNQISYSRSDKLIVFYGTGTIINTNVTSPMITKADHVASASLFRFEGLKFEQEAGAFAIFNAGVLRRTTFSGCHFSHVGTILYSADSEYAQSIYFMDGCVIRGGAGWAIDLDTLYDVRITNCIIEHRQSFFRTRSTTADPAVNTLTIQSNVIEGLSGKAIELGACFGAIISGNYFEGNFEYIDCSISSAYHKGLTIQGNTIQQTPEQIAAGQFAITWGKTAVPLLSGANSCVGNLHDNTGAAAYLVMDGDFASGVLHKGYKAYTDPTRDPTGYTERAYSAGKYFSFADRWISIDPSIRGFTFGGTACSEEIGGVLAPIYMTFGSTNPYTSPGNYSNRKWAKGSQVYNTSPAELGSVGSKYVVTGWICVTSGSGGSTGTDVWKEMRCLTGN